MPKIIPDESNFINGEPVQNGEKILVKGFRLVGKKNGINDDELLESLKEQVNQELTFAEIQLVAKKVQDFFRNKGYFLAQAFIPEQEVKEGIIIIYISEGKLDTEEPFEIKKNNLRLKVSKNTILWNLTPGKLNTMEFSFWRNNNLLIGTTFISLIIMIAYLLRFYRFKIGSDLPQLPSS